MSKRKAREMLSKRKVRERLRLLPEEIILDILSWLPVKSILRFRCVCKPWCHLLSKDLYFIRLHLNHTIEQNNFTMLLKRWPLQSITSDSISTSDSLFVEASKIDYPLKSQVYADILGSCNGLLCINPDWDIICIWNPSTREYKKIPSAPRIGPPSDFVGISKATSYGFGYDCKSDHYKVVKIMGFDVVNASEVRVCTVGSDSWRSIPSIPYFFSGGRRGVFFNGALHWVAIPCIGSKSTNVIVSFDIADEGFQEMKLPGCMDDVDVGVLRGSICVLGTVYEVRIDVWVMKDYGVIESWTRLFTINQQTDIQYLRPKRSSEFRLIQSFKNGEILIDIHLVTKKKNVLMSYDPTHERARIVNVHERLKTLNMRNMAKWYDIETYVGSLVSLKSGTYVGKRAKLRKQ